MNELAFAICKALIAALESTTERFGELGNLEAPVVDNSVDLNHLSRFLDDLLGGKLVVCFRSICLRNDRGSPRQLEADGKAQSQRGPVAVAPPTRPFWPETGAMLI